MARTRSLCVHCDLEDMTLGQGHDIPLGHGQQLSEILSKSNISVVIGELWPFLRIMIVCNVTLTFEIHFST